MREHKATNYKELQNEKCGLVEDLAVENGGLAIKESDLTEIQRASLSGIHLLAEISNIRFHIYRSEKMFTKDRDEVWYIAPNGFYINGTNDIYIDLNAGNNGEGTMMYTAAHEIMHFIKEFSPAKFQEIADCLMDEYAKCPNVDVRVLLDIQIKNVKKCADAAPVSDEQIRDMAFEEMVCDAMSGMLIGGNFVDSMVKLQETTESLRRTITDTVAKLLERWDIVVNAYNKALMDSYEARVVAQMDGVFRKLQQMFVEGIVDADNAYAKIAEK